MTEAIDVVERVRTAGRLPAIHTALSVLLAGAWFVTEAHLRGQLGRVAPLWEEALALALVGGVAGLMVRPRRTDRGERAVAGELILVGFLAATLPAAIMMVAYLIALVASFVVAGLCWVVWAVLLVLAIAGSALPWASLVGGAVVGVPKLQDESKRNDGIGTLILGGLGTALAGGLIAGVADMSFERAMTFGLAERAWENQGWIPAWTFLADRLDAAVAWVDHGYAVSLTLSTMAGVLGALLAALALRAARRAIIGRHRRHRALLPFASASLSDSEPVLVPAVYPAAVAWFSLAVGAGLLSSIVSQSAVRGAP